MTVSGRVEAEAIIDADIPIIDAHHHLWDRPGERYLADEFFQDLSDGHRVLSSVYIQCRSMYRADGPEALRAVGETEFVNGVAAMFASGAYGPVRACSAIVGRVDLSTGAAVEEVLLAHLAAGGGRFRGIRDLLAWDADPKAQPAGYINRLGRAYEPSFREGFAKLAPLGLTYDAWQYHTQLGDIVDLARDFPETGIVVDHCGTPLGFGPYAGRHAEFFDDWKSGVIALATCPNLVMKLGGLGMPYVDFGFDRATVTSVELAETWRPYIETCIEAFGPERCMFESNFPFDGYSSSYRQTWNAFKRIAQQYTSSEKAMLFSGTAAHFYRIDDPAITAELSSQGAAHGEQS